MKKISHFFFTLLIFQTKVGDVFFKFYGLLTISELYISRTVRRSTVYMNVGVLPSVYCKVGLTSKLINEGLIPARPINEPGKLF